MYSSTNLRSLYFTIAVKWSIHINAAPIIIQNTQGTFYCTMSRLPLLFILWIFYSSKGSKYFFHHWLIVSMCCMQVQLHTYSTKGVRDTNVISWHNSVDPYSYPTTPETMTFEWGDIHGSQRVNPYDFGESLSPGNAMTLTSVVLTKISISKIIVWIDIHVPNKRNCKFTSINLSHRSTNQKY